MPDDTQIWAVPAHIGTSPPYVSDSRLRNKKLNERLLTGKSRQRKLMIPSDSPFQKRNLTKFPMEHNRSESKRNAESQHVIRKLTEERIRKAKYDSENLRQYSLKMFDNAVDVHTQHNEQRRVLSELPTRIASAHNGPTYNGSILYNKRSNMLNSIRLRPKSEPPTRFNHLKSQSIQPQIKQTLCRSNREYTVSCVSPTKTQSVRSMSSVSNRSDFVLIPNGSISSEGHNFEFDTGKSEFNDSVFDDNENCSNASSSVPLDPLFLKRNLPSAEIHFYSIEEDSASESSINTTGSEIKQQPEEPKKELAPEPPQESTRPKSGKRRPNSSRSKGSASPKGKTKRGKSPKGKKGKDKEPVPVTPPPQQEVKVPDVPPVRKPLKGPKCWVDDATITSEKELIIEDETTSQSSKPGSPLCKTPSKSNFNIRTQTENQLASDDIKPLPEPVKREVSMVLEEIEQHVPNGLPSFICPSSEEKSRQEAIRDWLAKCCFESASRCVPLF